MHKDLLISKCSRHNTVLDLPARAPNHLVPQQKQHRTRRDWDFPLFSNLDYCFDRLIFALVGLPVML